MPGPPPEDQPDIVEKQGDKLDQLTHEQTALLSTSRAVQAIERIDDLERVVRTLYDQMKIIGLDFAGLAFQRLIDSETQTFEQYHMRPDGMYQTEVEVLPTSFREWQPLQVLYRRDLSLPEHRVGLPDNFRPSYHDLGFHIRCILHVPNRYGILTLRSETPNAFSDMHVNVVRDLAEMLGVAISRVEDLERLAEQNFKLAWANADLKAEIAERIKADTALRESEERFRQIAENVNEVFFLIDAETERVAYINPAYETIWGRSRERLYKNPLAWTEHIHSDDRTWVRAAVKAQKTQDSPEMEFRIIRPDGSVRWIWNRTFPVQNAQGRVSRFVGVAQDITDRKRAEVATMEAERLRALVETAGAAAHAINQPLTVIIGLAELLMAEQQSNRFSRNELNDILRAGMMISGILKKMQNIRQYATRRYVGNINIVDFDAATRTGENDLGGE